MLFLLFLLITQSAPACPDVSSCKSMALEAYAQKDFERFHDFAWLAHRRAGKDDPELLVLLARAQSLSGRPGDALVMLERRAKLGAGPTEIATDPDFAPVRSLPRWDEVRAKLLIGVLGPGLSHLPEAPPAPVAAPTPPAVPPKSDPTPAPSAPPAPAKPAGAALSFTTLLKPTALSYDAVSKRYLIADREAKRIAVVDEHSGQVSTLAGAQANLGDVKGMAIDARQGDLWVVSATADGPSLHRFQLISGRERDALPISGVQSAVVGVAFVEGIGVVIADARGDILRVSPRGKAEKVGALEYAPRMIAAGPEGTLYISAGGTRLARFALTPSLRRLGVLDAPDGMAPDAPFTVVGREIRFIAPVNGAFEIRK